MAARKLVVAHNFPPFTDGSAVTVAKRVLTWGEPVDVVSMDMTGQRISDPSLYAVVEPLIERHHLVRGRLAFSSWAGPQSFLDGAMPWIAQSTGYDEVYSRAMWPHSHFVAALTRSEGMANRWTAEFSDPLLWTVDHQRRPAGVVAQDRWANRLVAAQPLPIQRILYEDRSLLAWAQNLPFALADRIIFTNAQQMEAMIGDAPVELRDRVRSVSVVEPHPVPPRQMFANPSPRESDGVAKIGYFGTFYGNRGLTDFIEALELLDDDLMPHVRLDVYSGKSAPKVTSRAARCIRFRTELPYLDFLNRMSAYDFLLVNDVVSRRFPVANPYLPSKISDYRGSGVTVMALTAPGSTMDEMDDLQWKARRGDIRQIRDLLTRAVGAVRS